MEHDTHTDLRTHDMPEHHDMPTMTREPDSHGEHAPHEEGHQDHDKHQGRSPEMFRDRLWASLALTVPILYFSTQIQDWFDYSAVEFTGSPLVTPVLATALFLYAGTLFLRGGLSELRARQPGMMTLISLAITVAYGYSLAVSIGLSGKPFYWELATLLDVMLLGHWIEMRSIQSASRALEHLAAMVPSIAHKVDGGNIADVVISSLRADDLILIRPGEQVPADGEVVEGASSLNEAFLTGESRPVSKTVADEVVAGSVNGEGALKLRVTRTGGATTLSQIMRLVDEAQRSRSRFQALADRAAFWLTIVAIGVSVPTLAVWLAVDGGTTFAVARAVTVLVIACPHALGLAIPLVTVNATSISAANGILVRNREAFERGRDVGFVAFDKTGTLTEGRFVVSSSTGNARTVALAAALERESEHPLAAAIVEQASDMELSLPAVTGVRAVPGQGLEGAIGGAVYRVGRPEWAVELGVDVPKEHQAALDRADSRGESAIVAMDDGRVLGVFAMADKIRASARLAVKGLEQLGVTPVMITGDAEAVASTVASELGINRFYARVLPQDKAAIVEQLQKKGRTAFVGDGINDAPALLRSDLGVAIGAGTNVAIESADLVLVEDDPLGVVRALELARATHRKMLQNLAWATGYNTVALPLAAGVASAAGILLSPAVGALFMSLSTVIVSINAMLLRRVRLTDPFQVELSAA